MRVVIVQYGIRYVAAVKQLGMMHCRVAARAPGQPMEIP